MAYLELLLAALPFAAGQVGGIGSSAAPYPNVVYPNAVSTVFVRPMTLLVVYSSVKMKFADI
jgi:hypothetical protein